MQQIPLGPPTPILQNVVYALPGRAVIIASDAPLEVSITGINWIALPTSGRTVAAFVRCPSSNTIITCKGLPRSVGGATGLLTGLISYWKLDEASGVRVDSVGSNNLSQTGVVASGVGKIGNAAVFAGATQLNHATNPSLETGDIDFTFAYWIKPNAGDQYILTKDGVGNEYQLGVFSGLHPGIAVGGASIVSSVLITTIDWSFVVSWRDKTTGKLSIQVNDGVVDTSAAVTGVVSLTNPFIIGGSTSASSFYSGGVDEVGFWKRVLTPAERTQLYNSSNGLTYPFTPPVGTSNLLIETGDTLLLETGDRLALQ